MKRLSLLSTALLVACGSAPTPGNAPAAANAVASTAPPPVPEFDPRVDPRQSVLLCDAGRFRLSLRHRADAASVDRSYPRRTLIDPETLVQHFPQQGGDRQYRDSLIRYETCGPFVVRLQGEFLNSNLNGEMGGYPPFPAFRIWADNRMLFPTDDRGFVRLTPCDEHLPRFDNCPAGYAGRVDLEYRPQAGRVVIREWVLTGDILGDDGVYRTAERRSEIAAPFAM